MVIGEILKNSEKLKENLRVIINPKHCQLKKIKQPVILLAKWAWKWQRNYNPGHGNYVWQTVG